MYVAKGRLLKLVMRVAYVGFFACFANVHAQILRDGSIGPDISVQPNGVLDPVTGLVDYEIPESFGQSVGGNLFHSFDTFNISSTQSATFSSNIAVDNVISRVTGNSVSFIDGLFRSHISNADVYFVNPNGIVFGENASLDVDGAFKASTATTLNFSDGTQFDTAATSTPLLSMSPPSSFGFLGDGAEPIDIIGSTLVVNKPLVMQAGDITMNNAVLSYAPRSDDDATAAAGLTFLANNALSLTNSSLQSSSLNTTGSGGFELGGNEVTILNSNVAAFSGHIAVSGGTATIGNSILETESTGTNIVGDINVRADSVRIGSSSSLRSNTSSTMDAGNILVEGRALAIVEEASRLQSNSIDTASGNAGTITVTSETVRITSEARLVSATLSDGNASTILISGDNVTVDGDARLVSKTRSTSTGDSGIIDLRAKTVTISGGDTKIETGTDSVGDGGDIRISGESVHIENAATLQADSGASGNAGNVFIDAQRDVVIDGRSRLRSVVQDTGNAGILSVKGDSIKIDDNSRLVTVTVGQGDAGTIDLSARSVDIVGASVLRTNSAGAGAAGDIVIDGNTLRVGGESTIIAGTADQGSGGTISLIASSSINIAGGTNIQSINQGSGSSGGVRIAAGERLLLRGNSIISTNAGANATNAGDIEIDASKLVFLDNATVTTTATGGTGGGGDIVIGTTANAVPGVHGLTNELTPGRPEVLVMRNSRVVAEADAGTGGEVRAAPGLFLISADSLISVASRSGNAGTVDITSPDVDEDRGEEALSTNFLDVSTLLGKRCSVRDDAGAFVVSRRNESRVGPAGLLASFSTISGHEIVDDDTQLLGANRLALATHPQRSTTRSNDLVHTGEAQLAEGAYTASVETLIDAVKEADVNGATREQALTRGALGNALLAIGRSPQAMLLLDEASTLAQRADDPVLHAQISNNIGNLATREGRVGEAVRRYKASAALARSAGAPLDAAKALANAARASLLENKHEGSRAFLSELNGLLPEITDPKDAAHLRIHIAKTLEALDPNDNTGAAFRQNGEALLRHAAELSRSAGDSRTLSYSLGYLGERYKRAGRLEEALFLIRQALAAAEIAVSGEAIYRWHWQEGEVLARLGDSAAAIAAYSRAVDELEASRQESLAGYGSPLGHFRSEIAPVYLDLVAALLRRADLEQSEARVRTLRQARATAERLKTAELRNHFRDSCEAQQTAVTQDLDAVSRQHAAAVVYPIVFAQRLEILLTLPTGLHRYTADVTADELTRAALNFRKHVETRSPLRVVNASGQDLYEWLVAPIARALRDAKVETLVFVPDGVLRTLPLGALYDGAGYLTENYAVAVTPSLSLVAPQKFETRGTNLLLAGITERRSVDGVEWSALPGVADELTAISELHGGTVLLNESFTLEKFEQAMREEPVSIVHIASHGQFLGDGDDSYVLAFDDKLTFERLNHSVSNTRFREQPLELLVLSACETAMGDENAALGLAGIAVKAGARSALGSLWKVGDSATSELLTSFYQVLKEKPEVGKAQALRLAQLSLIDGEQYRHPNDWSAFLMINNWL